jgi:hypothetical protein
MAGFDQLMIVHAVEPSQVDAKDEKAGDRTN